jgi:hypothetical protein
MRRLASLVMSGLISAGACIALAGTQEPNAVDKPQALERLSRAELRQVVLTALRKRDLIAITNLSYKVGERTTNVTRADGSRIELNRKSYEVRWHPAGHWMKVVAESFNDGKWELREDRVYGVKDGEARAIFSDPSLRDPVGRVGGSEAPEFRERAVNQVLGVRVLEDGPPRTVRAYIEQFDRLPPPANVTYAPAVHANLPVVRVSVFDGQQQTRTFWFAPSRGWMTVRDEYIGGTPKFHNYASSDVLEAAKIEGGWTPLKVLKLSGYTGSKMETQIEYVLSDVRRGKVKEKDIVVVFPPEMKVSGLVRRRVPADVTGGGGDGL